MVGADMFIMYQDGAGNVTLSTRKGEAYAMPHHVERNDVTLLAGSGVEGDKMVANVQCSGCDTLNLGGSNGWISSWSTGDAIDSTDPDAMIFMHVGRTTFDLDFAQANIQADENPFVDEQGNTPPPSNNEGEDNNSAVTEQEDSGVDRGMIHGIIMTIVFVFLYPMGSLLMILTRKWWLHGIWQTVSFLLMWGGFASGYMAAKQGNLVSEQIFPALLHHLANTPTLSTSLRLTPALVPSSAPFSAFSPSSATRTICCTRSTSAALPSATFTSGTAVSCSSLASSTAVWACASPWTPLAPSSLPTPSSPPSRASPTWSASATARSASAGPSSARSLPP
jgi:hypothetical protein